VPVGAQLKTADGSFSFRVAAAPELSTWQQDLSAYVIPSGVAAIDVPVTSIASGLAGNVLANTITVIASSVPGVDQVTNAEAFTNGLDTESDPAFRTRFQWYLASLSKATITAVSAAVSSVRQGVIFQIKENVLPNGEARAGSFLVIVDDGSGYPPSGLLSAVASAVDAVRPVGTMFSVIAPIVEVVDVSVTVSISGGSGIFSAQGARQSIAAYVNALPIEGSASVTRVAQCIYNSNREVSNVSNVMLNGAMSDIAPLPGAIFKAGRILVSVNGG
jgi:uncharacterized phage protein gp47/JayE